MSPRINSGLVVFSAVTSACAGTMYYVHRLQVEERKEMRKHVEVDILQDRLTREATARAVAGVAAETAAVRGRGGK